MPINVYTGLMRSGKSYEVVSHVILEAIAAGRRVVTNVDGISNDLVRAYIADKRGIELQKLGVVVHVTNEDVFKPAFLPHYDDAKASHTDTIVHPGDLVCIDEAWRFWGADRKLLKEHKSFFLEHGHFTHPETGVACDLVLMIQDMGTLHRFVRNVVAFTFRTHKKVALGMGNTYSVTMWEGHKMSAATKTGNWVRRYNKEIFPLYSSFKGGAEGKMVNADKRQNVLTNVWLWARVGGVFLFFIAGGWYLWHFFHPVQKQDALKQARESTSGSPAIKTPDASQKSITTSFSESWRIVGSYTSHGIAAVVLANGSGRLRVESPSMFQNAGIAQTGEIDGERVTQWTGAQSSGFLQGDKK